MKMKKLLSLFLALVMALSLAAPGLAAEDDGIMLIDLEAYTVPAEAKDAVVILHSNDVHGAIEGYAKMAALKKMYQEAGAEVYLMDAGDFSQGTTYVSTSQGSAAVQLMNLVGYDVASPGNHEFDYGYTNLVSLQKEAEFPMLAANLSYDGGSLLGHSDSVVLTSKSGVKIGVFGLDTPEVATKAHPAKIKGVTVAGGKEMYDKAQDMVESLKAEDCDLVVCLGHLGIDDESALTGNRSIDLLAEVTGIDVFIDGHSHSTLEEMAAATNEDRTVNGTVITSTGTKFANIGVITIKDGKITTECVDTTLIPVPEDDAVAAKAAEIRAGVEKEYGAVFAKSEVTLNGEKAPGNRTQETNNGDLIADAILWYATKEDLGVAQENVVALTNGGGIRAPIAAGDVTKNDVNTVLPFGNTVAVVYVAGDKLLEALEASTFCTPEAVGGFPQVAGIKYTVDATKEYDKGEVYGDTTYFAPASIQRVTIDEVNGKDFDPEATYAVVTNDFVAAGGDTYYALSVSETITDTGAPLDEVVMQYITEVLDGVIPAEKYAEPAGRITIVTEAESERPMPGELTKPVDGGNRFAIPTDAEAEKFVNDKGWMTGTDKGFEGGSTVTRATVYEMFWKMEGRMAADYAMDYTDIPEGVWYTESARWATSEKLTNGVGDSQYAGDRTMTRAEVITVLYRYAKERLALDVSAGEEVYLEVFEDYEQVQEWAADALKWAHATGVDCMEDTDPTLEPETPITRMELARMLTVMGALMAQPQA